MMVSISRCQQLTSTQIKAVGIHATISIAKRRLHVQDGGSELSRRRNGVIGREDFSNDLKRGRKSVGGVLCK
jgi:hypothetical protein